MSFGDQTDPVHEGPRRAGWRVEYRTTARAEHYAALSFAIVLLRQQIREPSTAIQKLEFARQNKIITDELERLEKKRSELEGRFETDAQPLGGS